MRKLLLLPFLVAVLTACEPKGIEPGMTTDAKYKRLCASCHERGHGGAPVSFRAEEWAPRLKKGTDQLLKSVKQGIGRMPAGGRCVNCSDQDYLEMINHMSHPSL